MSVRPVVVLRSLRGPETAEPFGASHRFEIDISYVAPVVPELRVEVGDLSTAEIQDVARDPAVVSIAPRMPISLIKPLAADSAARTDEAWGLPAVNADTSSFSGRGVPVAVLDSGIDSSHAAFKDVTLIEQDFSGSGNGDVDGHGTHCAGTIFGRDVDGVRIGIARGVERALIGKVLDNDGHGSSEMLFGGLTWAVENGAQVISMSLGFDFPGMVASMTADGWPADIATSRALEAYRGNLRMFDAVMAMMRAREAFAGGVVVVAASGNESRREVDPAYEIAASLPAAAEGVVSVGALQRGDEGFTVASFSNTFPQIAAPGVDIVSAKVGGGLQALSGTSMAGPHVAGVVALWWEALRSDIRMLATSRTVVAKLLATARADVFAPGVDLGDRGGGIVTAP